MTAAVATGICRAAPFGCNNGWLVSVCIPAPTPTPVKAANATLTDVPYVRRMAMMVPAANAGRLPKT
jgi:hypothetical protein